jgi:hypothetical protein
VELALTDPGHPRARSAAAETTEAALGAMPGAPYDNVPEGGEAAAAAAAAAAEVEGGGGGGAAEGDALRTLHQFCLVNAAGEYVPLELLDDAEALAKAGHGRLSAFGTVVATRAWAWQQGGVAAAGGHGFAPALPPAPAGDAPAGAMPQYGMPLEQWCGGASPTTQTRLRVHLPEVTEWWVGGPPARHD